MKVKKHKTAYLLIVSTLFFLTVTWNCKTSHNLDIQKEELNELNFNSITDDSLKLLVSNFEVIHLPYNLINVSHEKEIDDYYVNKYLKLEDDFEGITSKYYYGLVIYKKNYFNLIISLYQNQGLSSMQNWPLRIYTFTYNGTHINTEDVACICNSLNIGSNEYYATSFDTINLTDSLITIYEIKKHGNILPEEEENPFEEITRDTIYYSISENGKIEKILNKLDN